MFEHFDRDNAVGLAMQLSGEVEGLDIAYASIKNITNMTYYTDM